MHSTTHGSESNYLAQVSGLNAAIATGPDAVVRFGRSDCPPDSTSWRRRHAGQLRQNRRQFLVSPRTSGSAYRCHRSRRGCVPVGPRTRRKCDAAWSPRRVPVCRTQIAKPMPNGFALEARVSSRKAAAAEGLRRGVRSGVASRDSDERVRHLRRSGWSGPRPPDLAGQVLIFR
jgi:hypothetical protein